MAGKLQDKKGTTNINEAARRELSITRDDYALCQYIHYRQGYPDSKKPGWCSDEKNEIADFIGISRPGLYKMIDRLERLGLLATDPVTGYVICTVKFIDMEVRCKQSLRDGKSKRVNKVDTARKQSLHGGVNKVTDKELMYSKNISKNKLDNIVADAPTPESETLKEDKKTKGATPAPRRAAKIRTGRIDHTFEDVKEYLQKENPAVYLWLIQAEKIWIDHMDYRAENKRCTQYASVRSETAGILDLYKMCGGNIETAHEMVQKCRAGGWMGLHPLNKWQTKPQQPQGVNPYTY